MLEIRDLVKRGRRGSGLHGPFRLGHYLLPALVLAAPGIWCCAALAFVVGERTRRPMAVYAVPTVLFVLTLTFVWTWSPPGLDPRVDRLLMLVDPTALRWLGQTLFRVDRGVEFYNTAPLAFDATLLLNRLLVLALPALAVLGSIRHFRRSIGRAGEVKPRRAPRAPTPGGTPERGVASFQPLRGLAMTVRPPGLLSGAWTILQAELRDLLRQPALYLFTAFLMLVVVEVAGAREYWRRNAATWREAVPAAITHVDVELDLEPSERRARVQGAYTLVNATPEPMRWPPFTVGTSFGEVAWKMDGRPVSADDRAGLHVLTPEVPLPPGGAVRVGFAYTATYPKGINRNGGGTSTFILPAGVLLSTHRGEFLPVPGFVEETGAGSGDLETNATAFPTNISFSEGIGFLTGGGPGAGMAFSVTAHEAAHQRWGHLLTAGDGPGTGLLVEGMANYSALLLHESEGGLAARIAFARQLERSYLEQRRVSAERPVLDTVERTAADEAVLSQKGAWVMWMLHNHLGRERMLAGLRELIDSHLRSGRHATPQDLVSTLAAQAADPAAYRIFVEQWLAGVVLPEYELSAAAVERTADGWRSQATITNLGTGSAVVEVAAVRGESERRTAVRLPPGRPVQAVWTTGFRPERIVVDPDALVLQLNRDRAVAELRRP